MSKIKKRYLDFEIYEQYEVDTISGALSSEIDSDITTHAGNTDAHHNQTHDNTDHSATYITSTGVTFEALDANGDVGITDDTVASGSHIHDNRYYTESETNTISGSLQQQIDAKVGLFTEDVDRNIVGGTNAGNAIEAGGVDNFLAGYDAAVSQTTADNNIIIGTEARYYNVTGVNNIAIGYQAGKGAVNQSAHNNVFMGSWSGLSITTGVENLAIGSSSLRFNKTGAKNTCVGYQAGYGVSNNSHDNNTFIGYHSGFSITTGDVNACLGYRAGYGITTGSFNVYIGDEAGYASDTGSYNVSIGYVAGRGTISDLNRYNTFIGAWTGYVIETAEYNTAVGYGSGQELTTGDNNTLLGTQTGDNITTGSNNLIIGYDIDPLSATNSNQFALGNATYPFLRGDMANYQLGIYGANGYLNFNTTLGSTGYGFRDASGAMEYKDSGGIWLSFTSVSGSLQQQIDAKPNDDHIHDGDTLQLDGINSDGGAFPFTTSGTVSFNQNILVDGGDIGITADTDLMQLANGALTINGTLGLLTGTTINEFSTDTTLSGNSDNAVPTEKAVKAYVDAIGTGNYVPVGSIITSASGVPTGYLECDGSSKSTTTYADLFAVIGYMYGGSGASFNIPDYRGEFLRGFDHGAGTDPDAADRTDRGDGTTGDAVGTKQEDEFDSHRHNDGFNTSGGSVTGGGAIGTQGWTTYTGGNETRPTNVYVIYCIRYFKGNDAVVDLDHGVLAGLTDDDHSQYLLAAGSRSLTGDWDFGSQTISGTGDIYCDDLFTSGTLSLASGATINEFSIDEGLLGASNEAVPTERAVKVYVDTAVSGAGGGLFTEDANNNVVGGTNAGSELSSGADNFYGGVSAGQYGDGSQNIAIGTQALEGTTANNFSDNIGIGHQVGLALTTGGKNILMGTEAGKAITTAEGSVVIGYQAGIALTAAYNTIIGHQAGNSLANGANNILVGKGAGFGNGASSDTANMNVAIGIDAMYDMDTAIGNTCLGYNAGKNINTSQGNVFVGREAGLNVDGGSNYNIAIGYRALYGATSNEQDNNVAMGYRALERNRTGNDNVIVGYMASFGNGNPCNVDNSVIIGRSAGESAATGNTGNIIIGHGAAETGTLQSDNNVIIGTGAGDAKTSGDGNVLLGFQTGDNITSGATNIIIGYNLDPASATTDNQFMLGNATYPFLKGEMNNYILAINGANGYLNFNTTLGSTGYGFRDASGAMEYKDSGGSWTTFSGSGDAHTHYDADMTYVAGSTWSYSGDTFGSVPTDLQVFFNGVKNKANDSDYYTSTTSGTDLVVVFAYPTSNTDWTNVTYTK